MNKDIVAHLIRVEAAEELKRQTQAQLQSRFKYRDPFFLQGVKTYHFPNNSYVRLGKIQTSFATGGMTRGAQVILLPQGEKLGFKRLSKRYTYQDALAKAGGNLFIRNGLIYTNQGGKVIPIYQIVQQVEIPQKLDFFDLAKRQAAKFFRKIGHLMED